MFVFNYEQCSVWAQLLALRYFESALFYIIFIFDVVRVAWNMRIRAARVGCGLLIIVRGSPRARADYLHFVVVEDKAGFPGVLMKQETSVTIIRTVSSQHGQHVIHNANTGSKLIHAHLKIGMLESKNKNHINTVVLRIHEWKISLYVTATVFEYKISIKKI